jgi:carbon starvation protein
LFHNGVGIPIALGTVFGILLVEGFVITTLDAAVRLNRYLFEELWQILFTAPPKLLKHHWFNSALSVLLMWVLAYSNAFSALWPIFGTANQLLAALGLLAIAGWLLLKKKKYAFVMLPALFMIATTFFSLLILLMNYLHARQYSLIITDVILLVLSVSTCILVFRMFFRSRNAMKE